MLSLICREDHKSKTACPSSKLFKRYLVKLTTYSQICHIPSLALNTEHI